MAIPYSRPIGDATALTFILHEPKEEILIKIIIIINPNPCPVTASNSLNTIEHPFCSLRSRIRKEEVCK